MKFSKLVSSILLISIFASCSDSNPETEVKKDENTNIAQIAPSFDLSTLQNSPFESIIPKAEKLVVDVLKGGLFSLASGNDLIIPANAFVHLDGSAVKGKVDIIFDSYKTPGEIILSGIDMTYDSAGVTHNFVSAGMYKIEGFSDGKPIKIAKDKSIEVQTYSYEEDTPCYNFYEMNEDGKWDYKLTKEATENSNFDEQDIIKEPRAPQDDDLVFDIEVKGSKYVAEYGDYLWKYDGLRKDTINMNNFKLSSKKIKLEKSSRHQLAFDLEVITSNGSKSIIPITPALFGSSLEDEKAKFQKKMNSINANIEAKKAINQGRYVRSISVPNFGIFNWDIIHVCGRVELLASFDYGKEYDAEFVTVYLVSSTDNSIVKYNSSSFSAFSYNPEVDNKIIATLPNNEVAVLNSNQFFKQINSNNGSVHFKLNLLEKSMLNSEDFIALVSQL